MARSRGELNPAKFVADWTDRDLSERAVSQAHFIQLCALLDVPAPLDNRSDDPNYCFEAVTTSAGSRAYEAARRGRKNRGTQNGDEPALFAGTGDQSLVDKPPAAPADGNSHADTISRIVPAAAGQHGFCDVWKKGHFCWEYKRQGKHADLNAALAQLRQYRDALDNPPLLIVCDVSHFEIHTNFTGYPTQAYRFRLADLSGPLPNEQDWPSRDVSPLQCLRYAFTNPEWFKPRQSLSDVTEERAEEIGKLVQQIRERKTRKSEEIDPRELAHFMMQIVFGLFAEDADLLPPDTLADALKAGNQDPDRFEAVIRPLFSAMATGGMFGVTPIEHFNGGLFKDIAAQRLPYLTGGEIGKLVIAAQDDWSAIEPSILGTLFERSLDPAKRAQIGAHYTSRDDIMLIVKPVIMDPLRREWAGVMEQVAGTMGKRDAARNGAKQAAQREIAAALTAFADRLASVTILDPACGSGNFLYVSIQELLTLEKEVINFAARPEVGAAVEPKVNPTQLRGIEINPYAAELARVSIWIGYLKWKRENGVVPSRRPILDTLDTIECRDAILKTGKNGEPLPHPAEWPRADFIVGNPPFLGSKVFRQNGLEDKYLDALYAAYDLPKTSDLCCYWFELGRRLIEKSKGTRAGLLATQGIRGGDNRTVLERIKEVGDIFMAWSDRQWVLDGAAVHVSIIAFDNGSEGYRHLDDLVVESINADLSFGTNPTDASILKENATIGFMGTTKGGPFELGTEEAMSLLAKPNAHSRSNSDVVVPWVNGTELTKRGGAMWVIDFGADKSLAEAAMYEAPFQLAERLVHQQRSAIRDSGPAERWWLHNRPRPDMREALAPMRRFIITTRVAKHRLFRWYEAPTLPDSATIVFARSDDYFFGVLHSCVHELWARRMGTQLREAESGFRYTPTTCFETFPLPWAPGSEPAQPRAKHHALWKEIGGAAADLNAKREAWLNPAQWIEPVEKMVDIKYRAELAAVPSQARALVRRSAVMAEAAKDKNLKLRTLTNLYNERPAWLRLAHQRLDRAVIAAYGAVDPAGKWDQAWADAYEPFGAGEITIKEKAGKSGRSAVDPAPVAAAKRAAIAARKGVDESILANLLRLNLARAAEEAAAAS